MHFLGYCWNSAADRDACICPGHLELYINTLIFSLKFRNRHDSNGGFVFQKPLCGLKSMCLLIFEDNQQILRPRLSQIFFFNPSMAAKFTCQPKYASHLMFFKKKNLVFWVILSRYFWKSVRTETDSKHRVRNNTSTY